MVLVFLVFYVLDLFLIVGEFNDIVMSDWMFMVSEYFGDFKFMLFLF